MSFPVNEVRLLKRGCIHDLCRFAHIAAEGHVIRLQKGQHVLVTSLSVLLPGVEKQVGTSACLALFVHEHVQCKGG
jgi:hypothetical protein